MWPKKFVDGQIVSILTSVLGQYVILDQDQLQLSLWSGTAELRNLAIRPDILASLQQKNQQPPSLSSSSSSSFDIMSNMKLNRGTIDLCKVTVPWASLDSEPLLVEIEGVDLHFTLDISQQHRTKKNDGESKNQKPDDTIGQDEKKMKLLALEAFELARKQSLELFKGLLFHQEPSPSAASSS